MPHPMALEFREPCSYRCTSRSFFAAIVTGIPGILIQLLLIPPVTLALQYGRKRATKSAVHSAINLISEGTASCVVIKENTIVKTQCDRGIGPVIRLYESGILQDAFVVDKIIVKAAAMIMTLGGVKGCYGVTMSKSALVALKTKIAELKRLSEQ